MEYAVLPSGDKMPVVGLGTWQSAPGEVKAAVETAIDVGYRHIDCAYVYGNENEVGEAIANKIKEGKVKREELFITTKLALAFIHKEHVRENIDLSLKALGLDYVDLYLIHMPVACKYNKNLQGMPVGPNGVFDVDNDFGVPEMLDAWREMEKLVDAKLARNIGVSNFGVELMEQIRKIARVPIASEQIETNLYCMCERAYEYCKKHNIAVVAYSPFGSPGSKGMIDESVNMLQDAYVKELATKHNKPAGNILLKYLIQSGRVVIPKSTSAVRLKSNLELFDFKLTDAEMAALKKLNRNKRSLLLMPGSPFDPVLKHPLWAHDLYTQ